MTEDTATPATTNSSAMVGVFALVLAVAFELVALTQGGMLRQLFELCAILLSAAGIGLGFSGFTVGRLGAPRMMLGLLAMLGNAIVLLAVIVLALV